MLKLQGRFPTEVALIYTMHEGAQGVLPMRVGSATSQLDLLSLTSLSVGGCGQLQLGVPSWAASVDYCEKLITDPSFCDRIFPTGRLLAMEDISFLLFT